LSVSPRKKAGWHSCQIDGEQRHRDVLQADQHGLHPGGDGDAAAGDVRHHDDEDHAH